MNPLVLDRLKTSQSNNFIFISRRLFPFRYDPNYEISYIRVKRR
jgi:hypothetical protein